MRYYILCAAAATAAGWATGCGPGKQLPEDLSRSRATDRGSSDPKEMVPAESDPAAIAIVDRAINAHTQNNPALLARAKISKVTANGTIKLPVPNATGLVPVPSLRTFISRWPDDFRLSHEFKSHIPGTLTTILRGSLTWWGLDSTPKPVPDPQAFEEVMRTDSLAIHWLPLIFPLREPGAIVFNPKKGVGMPPVDTVRFTMPGRPIYTLSFDSATGYLTRIEYEHTDSAGFAFKEWLLADPKPFDGMMLATEMKMARAPRSRSRDVVEEWAVEKWEFPKTLDDSSFEPPRQ